MTMPYHALATAKAELREAKDHEQTVRAITETQAALQGRNADDRKRELSLALSQSGMYAQALRQLRDAEQAVDMAQADVDQAETERRDREWRIRARLADALERLHLPQSDDIDWHDLHFQTEQRKFEAIEREYTHADPTRAQREMDELFTT